MGRRGFGNMLLIKHADGWVTAYAHADELLVSKGERVSKGQPAGSAPPATSARRNCTSNAQRQAGRRSGPLSSSQRCLITASSTRSSRQSDLAYRILSTRRRQSVSGASRSPHGSDDEVGNGGHQKDPFLRRFYARIPANMVQSFSDGQLDAIKRAFGFANAGSASRRYPGVHPHRLALVLPPFCSPDVNAGRRVGLPGNGRCGPCGP